MFIHNEDIHIDAPVQHDDVAEGNLYVHQGLTYNGKEFVPNGTDVTKEYPMPEESNPDKTVAFPGRVATVASRFSPWFQINTWDEIITDQHFAEERANLEPTLERLVGNNANTAVATAPGLLYDLSDFMYTTGAEYCSGYHMITLRRFSRPVGDCILYNDHPQMDIGRLVTYSTEDKNKLSEILKMSFGMNWIEKEADFWSMQCVGGGDSQNGMIGKLFAMNNPWVRDSKGPGRNAMNIDPMHDQNKVYGPVDSITKTHMRNRGLNFDQEITLTFEYDSKSIDCINQRQAMVDLITNMLVVTMNDGKFWGGANVWRGQQEYAHNKFWLGADAASATDSIGHALRYVKDQFYNAIGNPTNGLTAAVSFLMTLMNGAQQWVFEKLFDAVGRPAVAIGNSLLSGAPVGLWHITIGNPFRPILVMGNMIMTNSTLTFGDELGIDGFPTKVKLECTLKHAKPRGRAEIEMMFNAGHARTYWQPNSEKLKQQLQHSKAYSRRLPGYTGKATTSQVRQNRMTNGQEIKSWSQAYDCITDHLYSLVGTQKKHQTFKL